jgi:hypothetical protein
MAKQQRPTTADLTEFGRLTHFHPGMPEPYGETEYHKLPVVPASEANVISSLLTNGRHAPAIDIDYPVHVVPSRTRGHHHLYIDHELTWGDYKRLLRVMAEVGLVEIGYAESAIANGRSLLRVPGAK